MNGSAATTPNELPQDQPVINTRGPRWVAVWTVAVAAAFILVFYHFLHFTYRVATDSAIGGDWSHALIIPVISSYFIYQNRDRLMVLLQEETWLGMTWFFRLLGPGLLLAGAVLRITPTQALGQYIALLKSINGMMMLSGAVLIVLGPDAHKLFWGPLSQRILGWAITPAGWQRLLGLLFMVAGLMSYGWWLGPGRNDMLQGYSMVLCLFGLVLFLMGPAPMQVLWFPIVYLVLGVRIAPRWWEALAGQLQFVAARGASVVINLFRLVMDIEATVRGSTIEIIYDGRKIEPLNVAEACAGLRMLMAFIALGVAMAYLARRPWWQRAAMVLLSVPIAIAVNVGRVATLGLLAPFYPDLVHGDFHIFIGMLMLIPAAGMFWLLGYILDHIVIYDEQASTGPSGSPPPVRAVGMPARRVPVWVVRGLVIGAGLTVLGTLMTGLLFALVKPSVFLIQETQTAGGHTLINDLQWLAPVVTNTPLIAGLLAVTVALLATCLLVSWHWTRQAGKSRVLAQVLTMSAACGLLVGAAASLQGSVSMLKLALIKEPLPLRHNLIDLDTRPGHWRMARNHPRLPAEQETALGTLNYIVRDYENLDKPQGTPGSWVRLQIAYYTGTPDTVPHVPDRCFVAGGLVVVNKGQTVLDLLGANYRQARDVWEASSNAAPGTVRLPEVKFPATIVSFADPNDPRQQHNVVYFFSANGKFLATPDLVRLEGFGLRDRYSYYCKIEVMVPGIGDRQEATVVVSDFLSAMMPEILACLPDWQDVLEGRWPPQAAAVATKPVPDKISKDGTQTP
ncbi:MAG: exosortase/archaeosortase family protein [Phycisphaeraceae bacterium]